MSEPKWCDDCRDFHTDDCPWTEVLEPYRAHAGPIPATPPIREIVTTDRRGKVWKVPVLDGPLTVRAMNEGSYCKLAAPSDTARRHATEQERDDG